VVVALVVAADRHPGAVGQTIHGGFAELFALRLVEMTEHLERWRGHHAPEPARFAFRRSCSGDVGLAVEFLERVEDKERRVVSLLRETLRRRIRMKMLRLEVKCLRQS
jgi:hypothetical protein